MRCARTLPAVAAILLLLPTISAQAPEKPAAPPAGKDAPAGKEAPAAKEAKPLDEKDFVHEFDKECSTKDPAARVAAISKLGDSTRQLADGGRTRYVARALAKGLDDDDLEVQSAAVAQLAWGRDVETVLDVLGKHVENTRKEIEKRITRPDDENRKYVNRATRLFGDSCYALANYRDDRAVDSLASVIERLRPNTDGSDTSTRLVGRIAESLLLLGSHDAVNACIKQTGVYSDDDTFQEPAAKDLHRVLSLFASKVGKAGPDYTPTYYVEWANWFKKHEASFPKKLGKLKDPPSSPPADMMSATATDESKPAPR
jgi:plasmid stabilization system protein ParE